MIDDADYVRAVPQVAAQLEQRGFHLLGKPNNAWFSGRYRGLSTTWLDPAGGAAFEVQFHTPPSWRITQATHPCTRSLGCPASTRPSGPGCGRDRARLPGAAAAGRNRVAERPHPAAAEPGRPDLAPGPLHRARCGRGRGGRRSRLEPPVTGRDAHLGGLSCAR